MKAEIVAADAAAPPLHVGAIVRATNEELVHGGGVCGANFDAAPIAHAAITAFTPTHLQRCLMVFRSEESAAPMPAVAG